MAGMLLASSNIRATVRRLAYFLLGMQDPCQHGLACLLLIAHTVPTMAGMLLAMQDPCQHAVCCMLPICLCTMLHARPVMHISYNTRVCYAHATDRLGGGHNTIVLLKHLFPSYPQP